MTSGTIYFDTFQMKNPLTSQLYADATVKQVTFSYDGANGFNLAVPTLIKDLGAGGNADGLIFAPNGNLLIGGSTTHSIVQITPAGNTVGSITVGGTDPYHLSLSPDGTTVYSGGSTSLFQGGDTPGPLGVSPFFSNGTSHAITGAVSGLTQIAFDSHGTAYYTSSPDTGTGSLGLINLSTFAVTQKIAGLPAAHGITYDPYTGDLMLSGGSHITQVDPNTFQVISDLNVSSLGVSMLDQVAVDGHGHLFASDNGSVNLLNGTGTEGKLVFVDYTSGSHQVGSTGDFVNAQPLALALDDIAPLNGPGSVPEPALLGLATFGAAALVRRRCR